jgi:hypothetical protein
MSSRTAATAVMSYSIPFCGSGTTIIAAEKTGRRAHCLEIDPLYVDAALQRWEKVSGAAARHAESGRSFEVTRQLRHTEMTLQPLAYPEVWKFV